MSAPMLPYDVHDPVLAAATWSRLVEPGDRVATAVLSALGCTHALDWLCQCSDEDGQVRSHLPSLPALTTGQGTAHTDMGHPSQTAGMTTSADDLSGSPAAHRALTRAVQRWVPRLADLDIRRELDTLERLGGSLVIPRDPWWPQGLTDLDDPPICLWVRGDPALLASRADMSVNDGEHNGAASAHTVRRPPTTCALRAAPAGIDPDSTPVHAVSRGVIEMRMRDDLVPQGSAHARALGLVGARASTRYGERVAYDLARDVAAAGGLIVSGGAYGIDAAAHRGALETGRTLSISAGGVDRLYPAGHRDLLTRIIADGALVSEVPPGCQPSRHRFLSRNRLIAALSQAVIVVEAAWRSGALSTAHHALELGRAVGAVPGPVTSMESVGCHRLLRQGAVCVTDTEEVLELLTPYGSTDPEGAKEKHADSQARGFLDGLDPGSAAVLDAMPARASTTVPTLARAAGMSDADVLASLGLLELAGRVQRDNGGWRRRSLTP